MHKCRLFYSLTLIPADIGRIRIQCNRSLRQTNLALEIKRCINDNYLTWATIPGTSEQEYVNHFSRSLFPLRTSSRSVSIVSMLVTWNRLKDWNRRTEVESGLGGMLLSSNALHIRRKNCVTAVGKLQNVTKLRTNVSTYLA